MRSAAFNSTTLRQITGHSFKTWTVFKRPVCNHFSLFSSELVDFFFTFLPLIKLGGTFQSRYMCWFVRSFETLARDSRWSNMCIFFILYGHNAFYTFIWYIWYDYLLHTFWYSILFIEIAAPFDYSRLFGFQCQLFYFQFCIFYFALMAMIHWYVCALIYIYTYI